MKKILLNAVLVALFTAALIGCTQKQQWNQEERKSMREALRAYRQTVYLENLTDAEFGLFTDEVATDLENSFPVYTTFMEMDGAGDTVDLYVVTTIIDELNADPRNMRHIFPYNYMVAQGILPAGLDYSQQRAFYNCLAGKVNNTYTTMTQFVDAMMADTTDLSQLHRLQSQCANDLFDWAVTEVDIVETTN